MYTAAALATLSFLAGARAQLVGTLTPETHLSLSTSKCTASGCTTEADKVVIDANWRWLHASSNSTNCYTGNTWSTTLCPDSATCTANCALDGADYSGSYGITTTGTGLKLNFVTTSAYATNIGSRTYLMDTDTTYKMFKLKNQEFTFDVDVSNLPCGLNGALYFVAMDADGGLSKYPTNKAGAKYGTGYCDAQCPRDLKYINGAANVAGWAGSSNDANAGTGNFGSCCSEMDIWEANSMASAYTPHPCSTTGQTECTGSTCTRNTGLCDADGCDFNSYRMGDTSFLGVGKTIDTSKVFTVVTQFITADGTATGALSEIRRFYVQNGVSYANSVSKIAGVSGNSITDSFCAAQKTAFGDTNYFANKGGLKQMGSAMDSGMVLVMSIWDDHTADMLWLDSNYPLDKAATTPGVARGACDAASGVPATVEAAHPGASVTYSNIKIGDIGSTFKAPSSSGSSSAAAATTTKATSTAAGATTTPVSGTVAKWGQCGGQGYTGPTTCVSGSTCTFSSTWYSQCL